MPEEITVERKKPAQRSEQAMANNDRNILMDKKNRIATHEYKLTIYLAVSHGSFATAVDVAHEDYFALFRFQNLETTSQNYWPCFHDDEGCGWLPGLSQFSSLTHIPSLTPLVETEKIYVSFHCSPGTSAAVRSAAVLKSMASANHLQRCEMVVLMIFLIRPGSGPSEASTVL